MCEVIGVDRLFDSGHVPKGRGKHSEQAPRCLQGMIDARLRRALYAFAAILVLLHSGSGLAQQPKTPGPGPDSAAAASDMASFFSQVGDQIYEDCIFELSQEQIEVQQALAVAYVKIGASNVVARQLAAQQIEPPKLSDRCEQIKWAPRTAAPPGVADKPSAGPKRKLDIAISKAPANGALVPAPLANIKTLPQWDCAANVDYVTITHKGYERKLTGGEICSPFEDVVRRVPDTTKPFRLGYTIRTGRLFVVSDDPPAGGKTIAWAISGREQCRNNPEPECFAARAVGPLPPGEYAFASEKDKRVYWGPRSQRMVAGIYLTKLWHKENFTPAQTAAILARGSIAIHVRLKGEMSEACLGLGPNGWAYVASLIQEGRATGVNVYIDEPHPRIAEAPPVVKVSSFSLSSLFK